MCGSERTCGGDFMDDRKSRMIFEGKIANLPFGRSFSGIGKVFSSAALRSSGKLERIYAGS
jgi:hypothetical protein